MSSAKTSLPLHLDSTMRSCFVSCPQKFYLEFVKGYRPPGLSVDLHAGACFASAVEAVYTEVHRNKRPLSDALAIAYGVYTRAWGDYTPPEYKNTAKTYDRVWEAVEDYFATFPPLTDHIQPFVKTDGSPTLEFTFAIPLEPAINERDASPDGKFYGLDEQPCFPLHPSGEPFMYTGRLDLLGAYMGKVIPLDNKTSGASPTNDWSSKWDLRSQFIGYVWALQQMGFEVDSAVVRGTSILKTKLSHIEAIKPYSQFLIERWKEQLRRDLWRIRRAWDEDYWDFNLGETCTAYGNCVFMSVCQSPNPESWLSGFEVRHWNPLKKNPVGEVVQP